MSSTTFLGCSAALTGGAERYDTTVSGMSVARVHMAEVRECEGRGGSAGTLNRRTQTIPTRTPERLGSMFAFPSDNRRQCGPRVA